jgi:hypothetical protein
MDELKIPTTAREIRNMSFEEMDAIVARFEREKERRREAEKTNVANKIFDAIRDAQALGFCVVINASNSCGKDIVRIDPDDTISIKVTR